MNRQTVILLMKIGFGAGGAGATALVAAGYFRGWSHSTVSIAELAVGLMLLVYGLVRAGLDRRWRRRELGWRRVEATITQSAVKRAYPWGGGSDRYYAPDVAYRFSLDGVAHEGKHVQMDAGSNTSEADVAEWVARYPVGARVQAYVDPRTPKHAVLELDDDGSGLAIVAIAAVPAFALYAAAAEIVWRLNG